MVRHIRYGEKFVVFFPLDGIKKKRHELFSTTNICNNGWKSYILLYILLLSCFHYDAQDETINYSLLTCCCHVAKNIIFTVALEISTTDYIYA